ncbi:hypothetical protein BDV59DRAFT_194827 [Aspergillus ambiguus]|uniref:uncharacterized protein n=1 Tax=Aspergillus ambiguus TaxID=176160 RepID=UPI003CCDFCC8
MEPLAIIGYAVRYPQDAENVDSFWDLLMSARETKSPFPKDRINAMAFYHPDPNHGGTFHSKNAHFLKESPVCFDAAFFKMNKTELLSLDPQHRLVMENVYHALENAGIPMERAISSETSVFVNGYNHDHADALNMDPEIMLKYKPTGTDNSLTSGRVSWFYDFRGPSLTIDTACSGSLVGLHLACQSLKAKESNMAVVSGVNAIGYLHHMIGMSYSGFVGSEGKCFAFDHRAGGYARGEGVGTVIVKRLSDAVSEGDTIRAVIRGTGLNHDGRTPGITYPSLSSQEELIRKVYHSAGLDTSDTCYIESHGTGTQAGDFVEAHAISRGFDTANRSTALYVGALKSNIGHLEGGSGIAGLIKTILVLETGIIPPNLNFEKPNMKIQTKSLNLKFPTECTPWPRPGLRRGSISCFGLSGTNSHCILDDANGFLKTHGIPVRYRSPVQWKKGQPVSSDSDAYFPTSDDVASSSTRIVPHISSNTYGAGAINMPKSPSKLFIISGFDESAFFRVLAHLSNYIHSKQNLSSEEEQRFIDDLAFTLTERRTRFNWSSCVVASSVSQLHHQLSQMSQKPFYWRNQPKIGFVFTGQGAQYAGMGQQLLGYPTFLGSLKAADQYFRSLGSEWQLFEEISRDKTSTRINEPAISHPLCTAIQIAMVDLLGSWGISPSRVVGHSSGEIAAAYCAGKISRESAWKVAYFRGQVVHGSISHEGAMMAVGLNADDLQDHIDEVKHMDSDGVLTIACFNSPKNQTVSGDVELVDNLRRLLDGKGVFARKLNVGKAYHSSHMKAFTSDYQNAMGSLRTPKDEYNPSSVEMFSTYTGNEVKATFLDSSYWCANMVGPVRFQAALQSLCYDSAVDHCMESSPPAVDEIIEIGAHSTLRSAIKEAVDSTHIGYWPTLDRNVSNDDSLLQTVAGLSGRGYPVKINEINRAKSQSDGCALLPDLPPYPFDHSSRVIYESRLSKNFRLRSHPRHDIFGAPAIDWDPRYPRFRHFLRLTENPWLKDYSIHGQFVYPPAGFLAMVFESSLQTADQNRSVRGIRVTQMALNALLSIPDHNQGVEICLSYTPVDDRNELRRFHVSSYEELQEEWIEHCSGYVIVEYENMSEAVLEVDREANKQWLDFLIKGDQCQELVSCEKIFKQLASTGLHLGPTLQKFSSVKMSRCENRCSLVTSENYIHPHLLHPATLESFLTSAAVTLHAFPKAPQGEGLFLPKFIDHVWISSQVSYRPNSQFRCFSRVTASAVNQQRCQIQVVPEPSLSEVAVSFEGIQLEKHIPSGELFQPPAPPRFYTIEWQPDIHLLDNHYFDRFTKSTAHPNRQYDFECKVFTDLQLAATLLSTDALFEMKGRDLFDLEPHYYRFYDTLKSIAADVLTNSRYADDKDLKSRDASFFRKEIDPLHLMFGQDDLMTQYYDDDFRIGTIQQKLTHFLSLLKWNKSNLCVLEIGGGTGSFTNQVLAYLSPPDTERSISEYAKNRLYPWRDVVTYKRLDIGNDPIAQGFQLASFDLVVASNTLRNIRSLMKPGGKLIFHEGVRQDTLWTNISFSPLSGWWLGTESERRWCPYSSGFSGIDLDLMVSTAQGEPLRTVPTDTEPTVLPTLRAGLEQLGINSSITTLSETSTLNLSSKLCLALMIASDRIREFLLQYDKNFVTVSVSNEHPIDWTPAEAILRIIRRQFLSPSLSQNRNAEYHIEGGGLILTSRVSPNWDATSIIGSRISLPQTVLRTFENAVQPLKLVGRQSAGADLEFVWVTDDAQSDRLGENEVDIDIRAVSLGDRDLVVSKGGLHQGGLGGEASGIITRVGSSVKDLHCGDRVMCLADRRPGREGALRSVLRVNSGLVAPIPKHLSFEHAAALLASWTLAVYSLKYVCKMASGEKVLIHNATGSIGQAAIRYAQWVGVEVFATIASLEEKEKLIGEFGLAKDHIFSAQSPFLLNYLNQKAPGGVDIVLSPSSRPTDATTIDYIAPFGRVIEINTGIPQPKTRLPAMTNSNSVLFASVDLPSIATNFPGIVQQLFGDIMDLISDPRNITEDRVNVFGYDQLHKAFGSLQNTNAGNVIMRPSDHAVPVVPDFKPPMLEENASYIMIGAVDSLGLKAGVRLAGRGAKHLIFLSSAPGSDTNDQTVNDILDCLKKQGCTVSFVHSDLSNEPHLRKLAAELEQQLPLIKGVIYRPCVGHRAVEAISERPSRRGHQEEIIRLWNVHCVFSSPSITYFAAISPIKGLDGLCNGSDAQPTRTFQDALIRHRMSLGLCSVSVDLGDMEDDDASAVIEYATSGRGLSLASSQVITGLHGPSSPDGAGNSVPRYLSDPLFQQLAAPRTINISKDVPTERNLNVRDRLVSSEGMQQASVVMSHEIRRKLSSLLNVSEDEINEERNIRENGVDSLIEMEFQSWINKELSISLHTEDLISNSIIKLGAQVVSASALVQPT